jgi:TetR/AcrR family transcriptional repressor of nem operon
MDRTLRDEIRPAVERLRAYFDAITEGLEAAGWRYGCLIGNMSLEAPEHSELLRTRLVDVCGKLTRSFAEVVSAGQATGEIRSDLDADDTATFLLAAWEGAMMRMKVDRSPQPIEQFKRVLFAAILTPSDGTRN